jgi:hypothetical protein
MADYDAGAEYPGLGMHIDGEWIGLGDGASTR